MDLQIEKARASQHYMGWREGKHLGSFQSQEDSFFLTLPFIERANRPCGVGHSRSDVPKWKERTVRAPEKSRETSRLSPSPRSFGFQWPTLLLPRNRPLSSQ